MDYIYKLLDETAKKDLVKNKRIRFGRPRDFKSERKGAISIFDIFDEYREQNGKENILNMQPSSEEINKAYSWLQGYYGSLPEQEQEWCNDYYLSLGKDYTDYCPVESIVFSDMMIITSMYFQSYCAYFTSTDLTKYDERRRYVGMNTSLTQNKIAYVKIPVEMNDLNKTHWICTYGDEYEFTACENGDLTMNSQYITAQLHDMAIEYVRERKDSQIFSRFNHVDERKMSAFFKYLNPEYEPQNEIRYKMRLSSNAAGQNVIAFGDIVSRTRKPKCYKELIFNYLLSVYWQSLEYPNEIFVKLNEFECHDI